jgi:hypothetical protein
MGHDADIADLAQGMGLVRHVRSKGNAGKVKTDSIADLAAIGNHATA